MEVRLAMAQWQVGKAARRARIQSGSVLQHCRYLPSSDRERSRRNGVYRSGRRVAGLAAPVEVEVEVEVEADRVDLAAELEAEGGSLEVGDSVRHFGLWTCIMSALSGLLFRVVSDFLLADVPSRRSVSGIL